MASDTTEFSAKVPTELYNSFKEAFPQYGAVTWFINSSLEAFMKKVDSNPEYRVLVEVAVTQMLDDQRQKLSA